jgi:hypothetical protein
VWVGSRFELISAVGYLANPQTGAWGAGDKAIESLRPHADVLAELPLLAATYLADTAPTVINTTLPDAYLDTEIDIAS